MERRPRGGGSALTRVAAKISRLVPPARGAGCRADVAVLAELARLSTVLPDGRVEVCAGARRLLDADTVVEFELIGQELESTEVAGRSLRRPALVDIDDPDSLVATAVRAGERLFRRRGEGEGRLEEFPDAATALVAPVVRGMDRMGAMVWLWRRSRDALSRHEHALVDILIADKGLAVERHHQLQIRDRRLRDEWPAPPERRASESLRRELSGLRQTVDRAYAARMTRRFVRAEDHAVADLRDVVGRLETAVTALRLPAPVADLGFGDGLAALVEDARERFACTRVDLTADDATASDLDIRPSVVETALFVVAHVVDRAARAHGAGHVAVTAHVDRDSLTATVESDAAAVTAPAAAGSHFADAGMRERVRLVGGDIRAGRTAGGRATVTLRVDRPTSEALLKDGARLRRP
jgi:hypothetical protein